MARPGASNSGPRSHNSTSAAEQVQVLDIELQRAFSDFHEHSKWCDGCRNPVRLYEQGVDLCTEGRSLCIIITKLLYARAKYSLDGKIRVQYRKGWEAVDGLVRIITHYNQGHYSNEICDPAYDYAAAAAAAASQEHVGLGSQYDADLQRQRDAARRNKQSYGNPHTSLQDVTTGLAQADSPHSNTSLRSVHFNDYIEVRHFRKDS